MTLRDRIGEEATQRLHEDFWQALNAEGQSFVLIWNGPRQRVSSAYADMCDKAVGDVVTTTTSHDTAYGSLERCGGGHDA